MSAAVPNYHHQFSHNQNEIPKNTIQSINGQKSQVQSDRFPPDLPRIFVDNASTKNIVCFWCLFSIIIIIMIIIGFFLPDGIIVIHNQNQLMNTKYKQCYNSQGFFGQDLQCRNNHNFNVEQPILGVVALDVRYSNLFLLLTINLYPKDVQKEIQSQQKLILGFQKIGLNDDGDIKPIEKIQTQEIQWNFNSKTAREVYGVDGQTLIGFETIIKYYPDIAASPGYLLTAKFTKPGELSELSSAYIFAYSVDVRYTTFSIVIRIVCMAITLLTGCIYIWRFCQIPSQHRIIQQKIILALSITIWFFNDCLYAVTLYYPNGFMTFYSTFVSVNFFTLLLFSWVYFLKRINKENGKKQTELTPRQIWPTLILFFLIYLVFLITCMIFSFYQLQRQPIMPTEDIQPERGFWILKMICFLALLIAYGLIAFQFVMCLCSFTTKLWRNKIFLILVTFFSVIVFLCSLYYGYYIESYTGAKTFFVYVSASLYVIYLQYMYSLPREQLDNLQNKEQVKNVGSQVASALDEFTYGAAQVNINYGAQHQSPTINKKLLQKEQIELQDQQNFDRQTQKKDQIQMHPIQLEDEVQKSQNFDDFRLED